MCRCVFGRADVNTHSPDESTRKSVTLELRREDSTEFLAESILQLPALVVITGRNGSGKTRFLRRAGRGRVSIDGRVRSHGSTVIANGDLAREIEFPSSGVLRVIDPAFWSAVIDSETVRDRVSKQTRAAQAVDSTVSAEEILRRAEIEMFRWKGLTEDQYKRMRDRLGKPLSQARESELASVAPLLPQERTPFSDEAFQTMRRYKHLQLSNTTRRAIEREHHYVPASPALTDQEFLSQYGEPPWQIMTEIFQEIGLPFAVREPAYEVDSEGGWLVHSPTLVKITTLGDIRVTEPSTGERVLIRLTSALFQDRTLEVGGVWPAALLLDEPDAYLHPAMVRQLMKLVQSLFVQRLGIAVIMSTHSATTVALAPEGSLYLAKSDSSIVPVDRHVALNELLQGVPAVAVEPADRRLVIVEDEADEQIHMIAYTAVRDSLNKEQSLSFLGMTRRNSPQGGADRVKGLVADLRANDHPRVWGVVDCDNKPAPRPPIFAATNRYAIENFALDPLTLGVYLGQESEPGIPWLLPSTQAEWQALADAVTTRAFPRAKAGRSAVMFGLQYPVQIAEEFLLQRGHDLEDRLVDEFSVLEKLRQRDRRAGAVSVSVARSVWTLHPEVIDAGLVGLYRTLLDAEL